MNENKRVYCSNVKAKQFLVILILLFFSHTIRAQDAYSDSLKSVLTQNINDTLKVNTLIALSKYNLGYDNELAFQFANAAKIKASEAKFGSGLGYAFKYSGLVFYFKGQLREAMDEWQRSLQVFDSIHNKLGMANILNNIGAVYYEQGDLSQALAHYIPSLKLAQQLGDSLRIATAMMNIGAVYMDQGSTHQLALEYYFQALEIADKMKDNRTIGAICMNIGEIYLSVGNDKLSEKYFFKALENLKGTDLESSALAGLGKVEKDRKNYDKALSFYQQAYENAIGTGNLLDASQALVAQAHIMNLQGNKNKAIEDYKKAMAIATEIGANLELREIYDGLAETYSSVLKYDSAFKYVVLYGAIKDTLFNEAADKRLNVLRLDHELEKKEGRITQLTTVNDLNGKIIQRQTIIRNLITGGLILILIFLYISLRQKRRIKKEKKRSEELLLNILPSEIAEELKAKGFADPNHIDEVTVLFTDFKGFTLLAEKLTPRELVAEIHECFSTFDSIMAKHGIEKIKTIGDAYMAAGGLPTPNKTNPIDVVEAALEIQHFMEARKAKKELNKELYFEIRIGIHTGPVVAGIVGVKKFQYDIWGDTVNTASRMESSGEVGV